jgi:hypothetical protein
MDADRDLITRPTNGHYSGKFRQKQFDASHPASRSKCPQPVEADVPTNTVRSASAEN